jgi:hypothetical protein
MKNYYLKFKDQQDLESSLINVGLAEIINNTLITKDGIELDVIGIINKPTGVMLTTNDGFEYPEMLPVDGYNANLLAELTANQKADLPIIDVNNPVRKWAGE